MELIYIIIVIIALYIIRRSKIDIEDTFKNVEQQSNEYRISKFDIIINDKVYSSSLYNTEDIFSIDIGHDEFDMFKKWFNVCYASNEYKTDHRINVNVNGVEKVGTIYGVQPFDFEKLENNTRIHLKFDSIDL